MFCIGFRILGLFCWPYFNEALSDFVLLLSRNALKNIYNFLRPEGGDCLIVFMPTSSHSVAHDLLKQTKWSTYLKDTDCFTSPLLYSKDAKVEFSEMMKDAGFCNISIEVQQKKTGYANFEAMKGKQKQVRKFHSV